MKGGNSQPSMKTRIAPIHQPQPAGSLAHEGFSCASRTSLSTLRTFRRKAPIISLHPPRCKVGKNARLLPPDEPAPTPHPIVQRPALSPPKCIAGRPIKAKPPEPLLLVGVTR